MRTKSVLVVLLGVLLGYALPASPASAQPSEPLHWIRASLPDDSCRKTSHPRPTRAGIFRDPCSNKETILADGAGNPIISVREAVDFSWVETGHGRAINAVRSAAAIQDVSPNNYAVGVQVDAIATAYYGAGQFSFCNCPVNANDGEYSSAGTPWTFGIGCGSSDVSGLGHSIYNHAVYSVRNRSNSVAKIDGNGVDGPDTYANPSYYRFAVSSC
jgi:hypothetical protein